MPSITAHSNLLHKISCENIMGYLVGKFKHTFEYFKQHYTHFYTLFHSHIYQKHPNNITQTSLPNEPYVFLIQTPNKQTFHTHITIMKIKIHKK